jgi:uncharacterized protein YndB with AHSA1/START domain
MIDVHTEVNQTQRRVGERTLAPGQARTVTLVRAYDTTIEDLWDAATNPERIPRWFLPVSGDLRLGGRYQFEGNAGGTIERCEPPRRLTATWEFGGKLSWVELDLAPHDHETTRLQLMHITPTEDDDHWAQFGPGAVGVGWDLAFIGLTQHLASGGEVDRAAAQAWTVSGPGREFVTLSSNAWRDAHVTAGCDAADAQAAADRTTAFYTGMVAPSGS